MNGDWKTRLVVVSSGNGRFGYNKQCVRLLLLKIVHAVSPAFLS
jgi:hypothetical protein